MVFALNQILVSQITGRIIIPRIGSKKTIIIGMLIFATSPFFFGLASNNIFFIIKIYWFSKQYFTLIK